MKSLRHWVCMHIIESRFFFSCFWSWHFVRSSAKSLFHEKIKIKWIFVWNERIMYWISIYRFLVMHTWWWTAKTLLINVSISHQKLSLKMNEFLIIQRVCTKYLVVFWSSETKRESNNFFERIEHNKNVAILLNF